MTEVSAHVDPALVDPADVVVDELFAEVAEEVLEGMMEVETCVVCFEEMMGECMGVTECNHRFCKMCLEKIRETKPFCPLCRRRIGPDPPHLVQIEENVLHLLLRFLSVSSMLRSPQHVAAPDTRHVLLDIILGMYDAEIPQDQPTNPTAELPETFILAAGAF
eukprot:TRINITY_DN24037_c0_g1_i1.p1 TRINITY_DN24037_c0_g1~~TRINITY_DN24037_c0_g1_i1.p1  ORF type:complete len:163 (+),score=40.92 TRINITY_DN24037_c0_g1_i1:57-545(+)